MILLADHNYYFQFDVLLKRSGSQLLLKYSLKKKEKEQNFYQKGSPSHKLVALGIKIKILEIENTVVETTRARIIVSSRLLK